MSHASMPSRATSAVLLGLLTVYRLVITPWLAPRCRFAPSCSAYAREAIECHGPLKGMRLAIARVARCHPWHAGGHDPVPRFDAAAGLPSAAETDAASSGTRPHRCA